MRFSLKYCPAIPIVILLASACAGAGSPEEPPQSGVVRVVASIYPLEYFAARIGGDDIDLVSLVTAGVEAHSFEATPGDLLKLADADLVVMNGLALEPWLHRALDALGDQRPPRVLEAADPALAASSAASNDPHVWLDPLLAKRMAERVSDALSDVDPDRASAYRARAAALADDLDTLHDLFTTSLDDCTHREFVVSHAAFGHLADRYDLEQVPIAGLSPEAEPSARELADIADEIEALDLSYVLAEPTLSARLVDTLVSETGVGVLPAHQMESVTEEELAEHGDYVGLMRDNLRSLGIALGCMA